MSAPARIDHPAAGDLLSFMTGLMASYQDVGRGM